MAITAIQVVESTNLQDLAAKVNAVIDADGTWQPNGSIIAVQNGINAVYSRELIQGAYDGPALAISDITGLQAALDAKLATNGVAASATKLATARAINGHNFDGTAAITISGTDITTGTIPIAQLPVATNAAKGIASFSTGTTVAAGVVTVP